MLESIAIKNVATYDTNGIQINNLKKINFIYGANGCGKTTLTKYIFNPTELVFANCNLKWKNDFLMNALVYNKDFRDRNFGKGKIDGVFTLGQATKKEIEAIEKMQADLHIIKTDGLKKKETLEKQQKVKEECENEFREVAWSDIYKENENYFKEAFAGVMRKEAFKDKLLAEFQSNRDPLFSFDELKEKAKIIFGKIPTIIASIEDFEFVQLLEIEKKKFGKRKLLERQTLV